MFKSKKQSDFLTVIFFISIAFLLVYFVPVTINNLLWLLFIPLVWNSSKDYIWLIFLLILYDMPGGLFYGGERGDALRLPIYSIVSGFSFTIQDFLLITLLFKIIVRKGYSGFNIWKELFYGKSLVSLFYYFIILLLITFILGAGFDEMRMLYRIIINLLLVVVIINVLNTKNILFKFLNTLFPFVFIALLLQSYSLINGHQLITLFKPDIIAINGEYGRTDGSWNRAIEMSYTIFICFMGSLYFLKTQRLSSRYRNYYMAILFLSYLSMFLSGSRSWFIAYSLGIVLFFIGGISSFHKIIGPIILSTVIIIILINVSPSINGQVNNAWSRLVTVKEVTSDEGFQESSAAGRYDDRAPRVLEGFFQSTIVFGAGFSKLNSVYSDVHVGYHNLLLNGGVFGMFLWLSFFGKLFLKAYYFSLNFFSVFPIIALLFINFGVQTIGYNSTWEMLFLFSFSLALINVEYKSRPSLNEKKVI
jgi:hypothetical protein